MFAAKPILVAVLAVGVGYLAYPYVTLYRIGYAIHTGDTATLRALVDWPAVREGIKEDICDDVATDPTTADTGGKLPAFGAGFVRGMAVNAVDQDVTPAAVVEMTHAQATTTQDAAMHVSWAFFRGPDDFFVNLDAGGRPGPIRLEMTLKGATWVVTRIWLPEALLAQAHART
jgi:hypothetical protein